MKALCCVLTMALSVVMVGGSDLFLRAQGLDGVHGINARSWDVVGTILLVTAFVGFVREIFFVDPDPVAEVKRQVARRVKQEERAEKARSEGTFGMVTRAIKLSDKSLEEVLRLAADCNLLDPLIKREDGGLTVHITGTPENVAAFIKKAHEGVGV